MRSLEQLDRWIAGKVKHWTSRISGAPHSRELLEIRRDILEDIRDRIEPRGAGKSLFPYNSIAIRIAAENEEERLLREAAFAEGDGLEQDISELLSEAHCPIPAGFTVTVEVVEDSALAAASRPFLVDCEHRKGVVERTEAPSSRPAIKLTVVRGQADSAEYAIDAERVNIGRLKEVVGEKDGLRRRNDIAFAETETTVSREHAHIRYDAESGKYRLYDSGSQRGTSIFRDGRRLEAARVRGVQLVSGDEIHVGDARVKFEIAVRS
jgi:hypothetical protein